MKLFEKCFNSIDDISIYNWNKIHQTGDFKYLLKEGYKVLDYEKRFLPKRWKKLYNEYLQYFGFDDQFLEILEKQKKIALLKIEMCETGNGTVQTFIELEEISLEKKKAAVGQGDFHKIVSHLQKYLGFQIDTKKMSVMDFYSNLKLMVNERPARG